LADYHFYKGEEFRNISKQHTQALEEYQKSLEIRIKLFGENHADVANSYHMIGFTYRKLGDHNKSLEFDQKSLAIRIKLFGENHADVA
jgi:tetratricopeptide (TPR) repeat protein